MALRVGMGRIDSTSGRLYHYETDGAVLLAQVRRGDIQVAASDDLHDARDILDLIPN